MEQRRTTPHLVTKPAELTAEQARELTDAIRVNLVSAWEKIEQAYLQRADVVLGYESWDMYCLSEFGGSLLVPRENRVEMVRSLRQAGLPMRAIASATGASKSSIANDVAQLSKDGQFDQPDNVVSLDSKHRPAYRQQPPEPKPEPTPTPRRRRRVDRQRLVEITNAIYTATIDVGLAVSLTEDCLTEGRKFRADERDKILQQLDELRGAMGEITELLLLY